MPDYSEAATIAALRQRIAKLQRERQDERTDEKTNTRRLNARIQELIGEKEALQNRLSDTKNLYNSTIKKLHKNLLVAQQDLENANYAVAQSSDELRELREANKTFNGMCAENNALKDKVEQLQEALRAKPKVALAPGIPEEAFHAAEAHGRLLGFKEGCKFMKSAMRGVK